MNDFLLLFRYQLHERPIESSLLLLGCLIALLVIRDGCGRLWNRKWTQENNDFRLYTFLICYLLLVPGTLIWRCSDTLETYANEMIKRPYTIGGEAEKIPWIPSNNTNSYHGKIIKDDINQARNQDHQALKGKTDPEVMNEQRMLILSKNISHDKLHIGIESHFLNGIPMAIDWEKLSQIINKYHIKEIKNNVNYISYHEINNFPSYTSNHKEHLLKVWGAKVIRYLLTRQDIELILMQKEGVFQRFHKISQIYMGVILAMYFIVISCRAFSDIQSQVTSWRNR